MPYFRWEVRFFNMQIYGIFAAYGFGKKRYQGTIQN